MKQKISQTYTTFIYIITNIYSTIIKKLKNSNLNIIHKTDNIFNKIKASSDTEQHIKTEYIKQNIQIAINYKQAKQKKECLKDWYIKVKYVCQV